MTQILVVFTGGTIGSKKQGAAINVRNNGSYMLLDAYQEAYTAPVTFTPIQPLNILSENLTPEHWQTLLKALADRDLSKYDGVIITHGSDTLAYSANMLGLFLQHVNIPVMIVASNYPIGDKRANGLRNFAAAVSLIEQKVASNVYVVYENNKQQMNCYLATRITQCETFTDQFSSPYGLVLGEVKQGKLEFNAHPLNPTEIELQNRKILQWPSFIQDASFTFNRVLYIKPYIGIDYSWIQWNADTKPVAIVHDLYHSGTACAGEEGVASLISLIERAKADGIPVYLSPIRDLNEAIYASTGLLVEAGAYPVSGLSVEATLAKVHLSSLLYEEYEKQISFVQTEVVNFEQHIVV